jgi:hypothetical protein
MSEINSASFPLYTAHGVRVHFTVPFDGDPAAVSAAIESLLANGYTVNVLGVPEGADKTEIRYVVRGQGTNKDGGTTDRIWMYTPWGDDDKGSQLTHYLNTADDVTAFERAAGLRVTDLPICKGNAAPRRESGDFERSRREVNFSIIRHKEESDKSIAGFKWKLVQYVQNTPTPQPTRPNELGTPPTGDTAGVSGSVPKIVDGSDPNVFGELFPPSEVNAVTADALYERVKELFNARQHFTSWFEKHSADLAKYTTDEAVEYAHNAQWSRDKDRVKLLVQFGERVGLQTSEVLEALSTAAGKNLAKFSEWSYGNFAHAHAAVIAYHAGYNPHHADQLLTEGVLPQDMYQMVIDLCVKLGKASA